MLKINLVLDHLTLCVVLYVLLLPFSILSSTGQTLPQFLNNYQVCSGFYHRSY